MNDVKLLVATGDFSVSNMVKGALTNKGYSLISASNGDNAISLFKGETPAMVILDTSINDCDALSVIREIIRVSEIPVICIGKDADVVDRILYMEMGADDFIAIPFDTKEFAVRVKIVLRRYLKGKNSVSKELVFRSLSINLSNYTLKIKGETIKIPPKELELLYFLASNPNTVFNRDQILDKIWGYDYYGDSRTVDVHVKRLREKLQGAEDGWSIKTIWGVGYQFETQ